MKKSINIWSFVGKTNREAMKLAKDAGFEGIELALGTEGEITMTSTDEELRGIKAYAEELGIQIPSLSSGLCWTDSLTADDPAERQAFVKKVNQLKHRARQFYNYCNGYPNKNLSGLKQHLLYSKFFFDKLRNGGRNTYYDRFVKEITKYDDQDTKNVMMVMLETEKCCWERKYVANPTRVPFEMLSLPLPKDYDPLLTKQYGKWNVVVKGGSIHGAVIFDPDKSYKEYLKYETRSNHETRNYLWNIRPAALWAHQPAQKSQGLGRLPDRGPVDR